jgi:hypothetical protein
MSGRLCDCVPDVFPNDRSLFQVHRGSIRVNHSNLLSCRKVQNHHFQVRCTACGDVLGLWLMRGIAYARLEGRGGKHARRWSVGDTEPIPHAIEALFVPAARDDDDFVSFGDGDARHACPIAECIDIDADDGDFDLMFSRKMEVFVGSAFVVAPMI